MRMVLSIQKVHIEKVRKVGEWNYWDEQGDPIHYVCIETKIW